MKKYLQLLILFIAFISCSKDQSNDNTAEQSELTGKTFDYLFFKTEQECINAQPEPDFFTNCHREIQFIDHEKAMLMWTDMQLEVSYIKVGNRITIYSTANPDAGLIFEKTSASSLKLLSDNTIWNERIGDSIWPE